MSKRFHLHSHSRQRRRPSGLFLATIGLTTTSLFLLLAMLPAFHLPHPTSSVPLVEAIELPVAQAQPVLRTEDVWRQVYEMLPDLPLENQYVNKETRNISPNNTLISRLMRYHIYTKGRSPVYRLDWKLTLADYLGVNERMSASAYPSADTLRTNPMEGDIAAIRSLNRAQRDALVQALVMVFVPDQVSSPSQQPIPNAIPRPAAPTVNPNPTPNQPIPRREPQPGDAQLLITP